MDQTPTQMIIMYSIGLLQKTKQPVRPLLTTDGAYVSVLMLKMVRNQEKQKDIPKQQTPITSAAYGMF